MNVLHGRVPSNMAMHEPDTWVVGLEGENDETSSGQQGSVSPGRIGHVQYDRAIIASGAFSQDEEIVTWEMLENATPTVDS
jgi:hypothetical protein